MKRLLFILILLNIFPVPSFSQWQKVNTLPASTYIGGGAIDAVDSLTIVFSAISTSGSSFVCLFLSTDGGLTWDTIGTSSKGLGYGIDVSMIDADHIWLVEEEKIWGTTDGGKNWTCQFYDTSKTDFFNYIKMFDLQNGIAMGDAPSTTKPPLFLKTTDGGTNWISMNDSSLLGTISGNVWRCVFFLNPDIGYFSPFGISAKSIYKTTNSGQTWTKTNVTTMSSTMTLNFVDDQFGLSSCYSDVYRTTDGGNTWESRMNVFDGYVSSDIEFLPGDHSKIWLCRYGGLYFSQDSGKTWVKDILNIGNVWPRDLVFTDNKHGWLLCDQGNLYKTSNGDKITSVENEQSIKPSSFTLYQNYPNPFNSISKIKYEIANKSHVTLKVYDLLGRVVTTLVNEEKPAGIYEVTFNSELYNLTSGVYFYRLTSRNFSETKKLILLR